MSYDCNVLAGKVVALLVIGRIETSIGVGLQKNCELSEKKFLPFCIRTKPLVYCSRKKLCPHVILMVVCKQVPSVRIRQHANPLRANLQIPTKPLPWTDIFSDPTLPLWVDAGCGSGRFVLLSAKRNIAKFNYLGADIRSKVP